MNKDTYIQAIFFSARYNQAFIHFRELQRPDSLTKIRSLFVVVLQRRRSLDLLYLTLDQEIFRYLQLSVRLRRPLPQIMLMQILPRRQLARAFPYAPFLHFSSYIERLSFVALYTLFQNELNDLCLGSRPPTQCAREC